MTRKDYELIASILRRAWNGNACRDTVAAIARQFALELAVQNERFDEKRFLKACGVEG